MSDIASPLAAALAAAQVELADPPRAKTVKVPGRPERTYAGLDDLLRTVRPVLARHGLAISQPVRRLPAGGSELVTQLRHAGGEVLESTWELAGKGGPQDKGAELTYARRYTLEGLVGVAASDDDDAESVSQPEPVKGKRGQNRNIDTTPSPEDQRLADEVEAARKAAHHPSWPTAHKPFAGDVARLGLNVGLVMDLAPKGPLGKRPSQMDDAERGMLLHWLDTKDGRAAYDALKAERGAA
jgi:hypothetical protein